MGASLSPETCVSPQNDERGMYIEYFDNVTFSGATVHSANNKSTVLLYHATIIYRGLSSRKEIPVQGYGIADAKDKWKIIG